MATFFPDLIRTDDITVGGGRTLAFAEYGSETGDPVVFLPGAASGALMSFGGATLARRGIRLISIDRPGLGGSTDDPQKSFLTVAADVHTLVGELIGRPVPIVANSQGAPFGLAAALRGTASRLILASPSDEVALPALRAQLPDQFRTLIDAVASAPAAVATEMFASFSAERFFDMVMNDPVDADAPVYRDEGFRAHFRSVVEAGFSQGPRGYARDTVLAMSTWQLDLSAVDVPVDILFGAHDITHSPDQGETLAARLPHATRTVVPDAGGALLWSHPEMILDRCRG